MALTNLARGAGHAGGPMFRAKTYPISTTLIIRRLETETLAAVAHSLGTNEKTLWGWLNRRGIKVTAIREATKPRDGKTIRQRIREKAEAT